MPNFIDPIEVTDANGTKRKVVDVDGKVSVPAGDATMLQTGTDTEQRTWTAKDIHDEIARQIGEI